MTGCSAPRALAVPAADAAPFTGRSIEHHEFVWRGIEIRVAYEPHAFGAPSKTYHYSHLDIESADPRRALPITETGYRSHFLPAGEIEAAGGPVAYVTRWLDHAARSKHWKRFEQEMRQGSLF